MKGRLPFFSILLVLATALIIDLRFKKWENRDSVIEWDIHSYYAFLPAEFIYNDLKLEKSNYNDGPYFYFWPTTLENGKKVVKTTMGLAVMYAPFFFAAHAVAHLFHYPANGFSEPYKLFLVLSALFYLFIGLNYLKKVLHLYHFSDLTIALTILLIGTGTNLLYYSSICAPMPHVYNFCLFSIFLYYTIRWHENHSTRIMLFLGFLLGLISLIRPTNIIVLLFFAFYKTSRLSEIKARFLLFKKEMFQINLLFQIGRAHV